MRWPWRGTPRKHGLRSAGTLTSTSSLRRSHSARPGTWRGVQTAVKKLGQQLAALQCAVPKWVNFRKSLSRAVESTPRYRSLVPVLPARHDAHAGASADRGVFRAWCAGGQRRDRRPYRFTRHSCSAARPAAPRDCHEPRKGSRRRSTICTPRTNPVGRTSCN
jgi:hypothetical protein